MPPTTPPAGYSTVSPYLVLKDASGTLQFLRDVFDAEEVRRFPAHDGKLMHAEVRIGESIVMLADGNEGWPPVNAHVHVYVPDVDSTFRRAVEAGAEGLQEPVQKGDEDRRGGVRDPAGTTWWIATRIG